MNQTTDTLTAKTKNPAAQAITAYVGGYLAISLGAIVALTMLHGKQATQEAWVHGCIVAATSLLMAAFARGTVRGKDRAYLRLRITSTIMIVAIAVTTAIPGDFPAWMKIEQIVCGLLLIGLAVTLNRRSTKAFFSTK